MSPELAAIAARFGEKPLERRQRELAEAGRAPDLATPAWLLAATRVSDSLDAVEFTAYSERLAALKFLADSYERTDPAEARRIRASAEMTEISDKINASVTWPKSDAIDGHDERRRLQDELEAELHALHGKSRQGA